MARRVQKDFTFSNGLRIPAGNWIFAPNSPVLRDPDNYPEPDKFDGFRFSRLREEEGQSNSHTLVSSSMKNLQFGDGRHGWYVILATIWKDYKTDSSLFQPR